MDEKERQRLAREARVGHARCRDVARHVIHRTLNPHSMCCCLASYDMASNVCEAVGAGGGAAGAGAAAARGVRHAAEPELRGGGRGRAVQVDPIKPTLRALGTQCLKLTSDGPLSNLALKINLRRYNVVVPQEQQSAERPAASRKATVVGRCRLTVSKLELKARLVSALKTEM